jgi:hypothetical protein
MFDLEVDPVTGETFTMMGGLRVKVADEAECEQATFVVCAPDAPELAASFPDNVHTRCAFCDAAVVHRPYVPKRPPKICIDCLLKLERGES